MDLSGRLTAQQAADALGVSKPTLYAYTSRGQLRSEPVPGRPRQRAYYREDIERLRDRKAARRDPSHAAARGLHWGSPVLESAITLIHDGRVYYRGRDVLELARDYSLEDIAGLLWAAEPALRRHWFEQAPVLPAARLARLRAVVGDDPLAAMQAALAAGAAADPAAGDLRPEGVRLTGARIVRLLTAVLVGRSLSSARPALPLHRALQALWVPPKPEAAAAIRTALVLCADHELNASAFVARCAAAAGASPYDVVSAALATLKGHRHGGAAARLAALFTEAGAARHLRPLLAARLRRGETLPGFGHPLYPDGDPRARLLLEIAESAGNRPAWRLIHRLQRAGSALLHTNPNLDFGLVAVARAYGLPGHAPLLLFALARTVGWIAHALEQYASPELIRPRSRYTGPPPVA